MLDTQDQTCISEVMIKAMALVLDEKDMGNKWETSAKRSSIELKGEGVRIFIILIVAATARGCFEGLSILLYKKKQS